MSGPFLAEVLLGFSSLAAGLLQLAVQLNPSIEEHNTIQSARRLRVGMWLCMFVYLLSRVLTTDPPLPFPVMVCLMGLSLTDGMLAASRLFGMIQIVTPCSTPVQNVSERPRQVARLLQKEKP